MPEPRFAIYAANGSFVWPDGHAPPELSYPIPIATISTRNLAQHVVEFLSQLVPQAVLTIEPLPREASHTERRRIRRCLDAAREDKLGPDVRRLVIEADQLMRQIEDQPDLLPCALPDASQHQPINDPWCTGSDEAGSTPAGGLDESESRDAPSRIRGRPQLIGLLQKAEEQLRLLGTVEQRGADWFLAIGKAFEHFPRIYYGLGAIGFLTEGQELIHGRDQVLQAVAPVVVSRISVHGPKEATELAQVLGIPADSDSGALEKATKVVVDAALEMADRIARVCQYVQATPAPIPEDVYQTESDGAYGAPPAAAATRSTPPGVDPLVLAALARKTADRIRKVPYQISHILNSDPRPEYCQIREQLEPLKIKIDFLPVVTYVERNWTPAHAQALAGQIHKVTDTVDSFLSWYQTATANCSRDSFMWRREENASFLVLCLMIAQQVAQWAADIADRAQRDSRHLSTTGDKTTVVHPAKEPVAPWNPPLGYVGRKTICSDPRFQKGGKNPPASTIDVWVKAAERKENPVKIERAPDSGENHYPESWIMEQIATWYPRKPRT
ncbi:MAG: hypothetical protein AABZ47_14075 [Planctomycetota bacterium]